MSDIIWEDPPSIWSERRQQLVEHPGKWVKTEHYASLGSAYKEGTRALRDHLPIAPVDWEAFVRYTDPADRTKGADLYVRYLGEDSA